jgi:iduronate 2-sulfatase
MSDTLLLRVSAFALWMLSAGALSARTNVLLIAIDDLRAELGCYGDKHIVSPHMDGLAAEGRLFTRHYVQTAICGPSRCSLMTGRRVDWSWDVWGRNRKSRKRPPQPESFADHFRRQGYRTVQIGKITHQPGGVMDRAQEVHQLPFSWDLAYAPVGPWQTPWYAFFSYDKGRYREYGYGKDNKNVPPSEAADVPDTGYADGLNAEEAVKQLRDLDKGEKPFLLAVGFYKPHLPHNAPKRYWDLYDETALPVVENTYPPKNTNPKISTHDSYELTDHYYWPHGKGVLPPDRLRHHRHAYAAAVSYVDAQIGKVLDELTRLGLDRNTVVVLWSDHGWHLGEHGMCSKPACYETVTRSPLIIRTPDMSRAGQAAPGLVETVDIYPTLVDLCGLPLPEGLAGASLRPLLDDPGHPGKDGAHSYCRLNGYHGHALRTDRWRLVEWTHAKSGKVGQVELYDHKVDPGENVNVSADHPEIVKRLLPQLRRRQPVMQSGSREDRSSGT